MLTACAKDSGSTGDCQDSQCRMQFMAKELQADPSCIVQQSVAPDTKVYLCDRTTKTVAGKTYVVNPGCNYIVEGASLPSPTSVWTNCNGK